jgi:hypothetical protein
MGHERLGLVGEHRVVLQPQCLHRRGREPELRFLLPKDERVLPVWLDGRLQIMRWGSRRRQSRNLWVTGWTWQATVEGGAWAALGGEPVVIPATFGLDRGVWYHVREGVRGVAVRDEEGQPVVYVVCEPASHYYQVMTRSSWMPVHVNDRI